MGGLKHSDLPLYGVIRGMVIALVPGRQPLQYVKRRNDGNSCPEHPTPGTLSETELDVVAACIRTGQATLEELQAIGGGH
jgi:hypothetical protein